MKIAFTADWHIRGKDLDDCRAQLLQFANEARKANVDSIVIAGDIFESPNIVDQQASSGAQIALASEIMGLLAEFCEDIIIIRGNHDQSGAGSADALHVFDPFTGGDRPHVTIVRSRTALLRRGAFLVCLPWQWDIGLGAEQEIRGLVQHCEATNSRKPMIFTGHVQVGGARNNDGGNYEQRADSWSISRAYLEESGFAHVALGHEHTRQDFSGGHGGFVGSLRQCNFGEEGNPTGFEVYDTRSRETEWIELDAAPKFRTAIVEPKTQDEIDMAAIFGPEHTPDQLPRIGENLRVQYMGGAVDHVEIKRLEKQGVVVEHFVEAEERVRRAEVPAGVLQNPHALIDLWAGQQEPAIDEERLGRMKRLHDETHADAAPKEAAKS